MREQSGRIVASLALGAGLVAILANGSVSAVTDQQAGNDDFRCGRSSPLLDRLGDAYLDLETPASELERARGIERLSIADAIRGRGGIDMADAARLGSLYGALSAAPLGSGNGYRVQCRGSGDGAPEEVLWRFDLEQVERIGTLAGKTLITAFEKRFEVIAASRDRLVADVLVAEVMTLPAASTWYLDEDGRALRSTLRARRRAVSSSRTTRAYLLEIDWTLATIGGDLELAQTFYTNGVASERAVWRLSR